MDQILTNWSFYLILVGMLLGAFLIGYFFGGAGNRSVVVKTEKVAVPLTPTKPSNGTPLAATKSSLEAPKPKHVDIDELTRPGPVRAQKTRERSGSLSNDAKITLAEEKLNFESLGKGDRFNKDDFQKLTGIGPFIEEKLNTIGIYNYQQLANMTESDIDVITTLIDFFPGRIRRDDWKGQAQVLVQEKNQTQQDA